MKFTVLDGTTEVWSGIVQGTGENWGLAEGAQLHRNLQRGDLEPAGQAGADAGVSEGDQEVEEPPSPRPIYRGFFGGSADFGNFATTV
jgi:hypothetical protein